MPSSSAVDDSEVDPRRRALQGKKTEEISDKNDRDIVIP